MWKGIDGDYTDYVGWELSYTQTLSARVFHQVIMASSPDLDPRPLYSDSGARQRPQLWEVSAVGPRYSHSGEDEGETQSARCYSSRPLPVVRTIVSHGVLYASEAV